MVNPSPFHQRAFNRNIQIPSQENETNENQPIEEFQENFPEYNEESPFQKRLVEKKEIEEESNLDTLFRHAKRSGLRIGESIAGFPGNVYKSVKSLANWLPKPPEFMQKDPNFIQKFGKNLLEKLPSSHELKQKSEERFGKESKPQNEWEKNADEIVETTTNMFMPGTGFMRMSTRLLAPILGQAGKFFTKELGGSETKQEIAKNVLMMGMGIANQPGARATAANAMRESEAMVPQNATFNTAPLERALQQIENQDWMRTAMTSPHPSPAARPIINSIENIRSHIQNGQMNARTAVQLRKDINETARNLGAFEIEAPADRITAIQRLGRLRNDFVEHGIGEYGRQNPRFWQANQAANRAFAATERGGAIANYIMQNYNKPFISDSAKILFGHALSSGTGNIAKLATAAATLSGINAVTRVMYRISQSDVLRRHYANVLLNASQNHAASMAKSLAKLDKELKKDEVKEKYFEKKNQKSSFSP